MEISRRTLLLACSALLADMGSAEEENWTVYILNDSCSDYTWGNSEEQTRQNFAEIVRAHLDEMTRTDSRPQASQNRYNCSILSEVLLFLERYPDRKDELVRRVREGRLFLSPYLNNALLAFQSFEAALRNFYPARRLEREWGIRFDIAEHIEEPSLPWGTATILAGCGIRWLSVPFLDYDSTLAQLKNPPVFRWEGPDGTSLNVLFDAFAGEKANYAQGAWLLADPKRIAGEWVPHYRDLGPAYPWRAAAASGTHSDLYASSTGQVRKFSDAIAAYNDRPAPHTQLVNATLRQFCDSIDRGPVPPQRIRGCFGHSWDLWPVTLAVYAARAREADRQFLAAETLSAVAAWNNNEAARATAGQRREAEFGWAMMADHAWNGRGEANRLVNAGLRKNWLADLERNIEAIRTASWNSLGLTPSDDSVTLFNPQSFRRSQLVRLDVSKQPAAVRHENRALPSQLVEDEGRRTLCFVSPAMDGYAFQKVGLAWTGAPAVIRSVLRAAGQELEGPFYRVRVDPHTGGVASLVHKKTGHDLVAPGNRTLAQSIYYESAEYTTTSVTTEVWASGPVLAGLRVSGIAAGIRTTLLITIYAQIDRVDLEFRIQKPVSLREHRLCHLFPVMGPGAVLRIETTAAILKPKPQPEGDLLPGADARRFAIQGFLDASLRDGPGVTIVPLDSFFLRLDLDPLTMEAIGNDQNYAESIRDQHERTDFRFRYSLRAHAEPFQTAAAVAFSRDASSELLTARGVCLTSPAVPVRVDPKRAIATCLKPADSPDERGIVMRVWEVGEGDHDLEIISGGCKAAHRADLLERDQGPLKVEDGRIQLPLRMRGYASVRLEPEKGNERGG